MDNKLSENGLRFINKFVALLAHDFINRNEESKLALEFSSLDADEKSYIFVKKYNLWERYVGKKEIITHGEGATVYHMVNLVSNLDLSGHIQSESNLNPCDIHCEGFVTFLSIAGRERKIELCRLLVERHGADVNYQDDDGKTALHYIASKIHINTLKDLDVFKYFILNGADLSLEDNDGKVATEYLSGDANHISVAEGLASVLNSIYSPGEDGVINNINEAPAFEFDLP